MDESCGKCVPCRAGTAQIFALLSKIVDRKADLADIDKLKALCDLVKNTSLCGLGQTAANPVLSTLRYFESEYTERLIDRPGSGFIPLAMNGSVPSNGVAGIKEL
jgi:bidirectional [NiFe] hydrogenase diaphorase subunit